MSKLCAKPECRAWAMRGKSFCRSHLGKLSEEELELSEFAEPEEPPRDFRYGQYSAPVTLDERTTLQALERGSGLKAEIELARLVVLRALNEDDSVTLGKSLLVLKTLVMEERRLNGGQIEGIFGSLTYLLGELSGRGN